MDALKYHWHKTSLLFQPVLKMRCLKISSLCKGPVLYPAKNEEIYMAFFHIKNFQVMLRILTLKKKTSTCGHKWVVCESHLECSVVSGSAAAGVTHFQP